MIPVHREYSVDIKKLKFETADGTRFPWTAMVNFYVADRERPFLELFGHMKEEEIYRAIDNGEEINLDQCYVEKFSLRDYRLTRNMDERQKVVIKGFSARNTLFGNAVKLDLSNAVFEGDRFTLEDAWISKGDVSFESSRFRSALVSFHHARFPDGNLSFKNTVFDSADVDFKNCRFGKGEKDFQYMKLGRGNLNFTNAEFSDGNVNYINTDFGSGEVSFKVARFGTGRIDFHYSRFSKGSVSFERTEFGDGRVDFRIVEFGSGRVNFNRSVFGSGEVSFDECEKTGGKFNFKRVTLGSGGFGFENCLFNNVDASFERTHFVEGKASFYRSSFRSLSLRFCHLNDYMDLRVRECGELDLSSTVVRDILDMDPHEFRSEIGIFTMAGMRLLGKIYIDWRRTGVARILQNYPGSTYRIKSEQFRILKENYQSLGLYSYEDKAYVEFKRNEAKADLKEAVKKDWWRGLGHYPYYGYKWLLYDKAGLYATRPARVLWTMLVTYVLFSLVFAVMIQTGEADIIPSVDDQLTVISRAFYHSAITFLTIGYGDHYPYGAIRWVSSLEGFVGVFLMSYLVVAFVRKILR